MMLEVLDLLHTSRWQPVSSEKLARVRLVITGAYNTTGKMSFDDGRRAATFHNAWSANTGFTVRVRILFSQKKRKAICSKRSSVKNEQLAHSIAAYSIVLLNVCFYHLLVFFGYFS
jgi:hypothetical protein